MDPVLYRGKKENASDCPRMKQDLALQTARILRADFNGESDAFSRVDFEGLRSFRKVPATRESERALRDIVSSVENLQGKDSGLACLQDSKIKTADGFQTRADVFEGDDRNGFRRRTLGV
jgi:hypothetical protein